MRPALVRAFASIASIVAIVAVAVVAIPSAGCRRAPEEPIAPHDAEVDASGVVVGGDAGSDGSDGSASAQGSAAPTAGAALDDAGRSELRAFCNDAYSADSERNKAQCSPVDFGVTQGVARAAGNLCFSDLAPVVARGRATFDAAAARACVDMLRARPLAQASEADTFFLRPPCDRVLVGAGKPGQPCRASVECGEGLACVGYGPRTDGACARPPAVGQPCSTQVVGAVINQAASAVRHPACARGAWCDGAVCRVRAAAGSGCSDTSSCAEGLACVKGRCGPLLRTGGSCMKSADCAFGLWCDRTGDGGAGSCASRRAEGQGCASADECKGRCDLPRLSDGGVANRGTCVAVCGSG
jgi:hypothetical protein